MRSPRFWTFLMLGLFALLLGASWLLDRNRRESAAFPSIVSERTSGVSIFAELLQAEGFRVRREPMSGPRVKQGEIVVEFEAPWPDREYATPGNQSALRAWEDSKDPTRVVLRHSQEFGAEVALVGPQKVTYSTGREPEKKSFQVLRPGPLDVPSMGRSAWDADDRVAVIVQEVGGDPVSLVSVGSETQLFIENGIFATNRLIDREQHADFLLHVFRTYLPAGSTLVFLEPMPGESLLAQLGPWAEILYYQAIVLFVVMVWAYGQRLGLPDVFRRRQQGAREMVDALGDAMFNRRTPQDATEILAADYDARIKRALALPASTSREDRNARLSESVRAAMAVLENPLPKQEKFRLDKVRSAMAEIESWLAAHRSRRV